MKREKYAKNIYIHMRERQIGWRNYKEKELEKTEWLKKMKGKT